MKHNMWTKDNIPEHDDYVKFTYWTETPVSVSCCLCHLDLKFLVDQNLLFNMRLEDLFPQEIEQLWKKNMWLLIFKGNSTIYESFQLSRPVPKFLPYTDTINQLNHLVIKYKQNINDYQTFEKNLHHEIM